MGASVVTTGLGIFEDNNIFMNLLRVKLRLAMEDMVNTAVQKMTEIMTSTRQQQTGDLLRAIGSKVYNEGLNIVIGEFGFENSQQLYYILQAGNQPAGGITGFTHVPDGQFIEANFAMRDAYMAAIERLIIKMEEPIL